MADIDNNQSNNDIHKTMSFSRKPELTSISRWVRNRQMAHPVSVCKDSAVGSHLRANLGSSQQRLQDEIRCCLYRRLAPSGFSDFSTKAIFNLEFSPSGNILVAACEENSMLLFDPLTTKHLTTVRNAHTDCVNCIRFLDSRTFASGSDDSTIALWDIRNLKHKVRCLRGHTNWVKSIEYCHLTKKLVTSAFDGSVLSWDINSYEENGTPHERVFYIESLMRSRLTLDCTKLVMSTACGFYIIIHDLDLSTLKSDLADVDFSDYPDSVDAEDCNPELRGRRLPMDVLTRSRNRVEVVLDFPDNSEASCISSLVLHPHGWCMVSRYTTIDNDAEWTCVHDLQDPWPSKDGPTKRLMFYTEELMNGRGYIKELSISPDGRLICSCFGSGVQLLSFDQKCSELCDIPHPRAARRLKLVKFLEHKGTVLTSRFSPTHCLLASGSMCGRVAFYQPKL